LQKRKFEKRTFDRSMRPEYEFGHLDQPGESGGGTDAWNADAALEARREAGTGFDEPVACEFLTAVYLWLGAACALEGRATPSGNEYSALWIPSPGVPYLDLQDRGRPAIPRPRHRV
jgi:hypothetical protein